MGIPDALQTDFNAKLTAYAAAYTAAEAPNAGKIDRERREALTKIMRKIKKAYLDADPLDVVTPEILLDFGLHTKDTPAPMSPTPPKSSRSPLRTASIYKSS